MGSDLCPNLGVKKGDCPNEFGNRFNRREDADMFEQTLSRLCAGKALPMPS